MTVEEAITYLRQLVPPSARHLKAMRLAKEALEKQIPKKANGSKCPLCGAELFWEGRVLLPTCPCGQKIDWSEE